MARKINDKELLQLSENGKTGEQIAEIFQCSPAAVCRRLQKLRRPLTEKLTHKEQVFCKSVASGLPVTQAATLAFDVSNSNSAKTIGVRLMQNAEIKLAINEIMEMQGLDRSYLVGKLKQHVDNEHDPQISLRAVDLGLKLHDSYPANKTVNLNVNVACDPVDLSKYRRA